ncbi:hypothetical protein [Galactobacter caseinivorans]|uniref:Uncharacterized protein n=1 Tax=Galactobacter caseinivorans TaxID=2676123 RepID=A0A496PJ31_9MICC|nr:hypothetical protein [Galactobacter caseinivorans]RKW70505.1 hypothetical protein DWQ67_08515 [Galactobacter caseinivorans]
MGTTPQEQPRERPPLIETNVDHLLPTQAPPPAGPVLPYRPTGYPAPPAPLAPLPPAGPQPYAVQPYAPQQYGAGLVAAPVDPASEQASLLWRRYWLMTGVIMVGGAVLAVLLGLVLSVSLLFMVGLVTLMGVLVGGGFFAMVGVGIAAAATALTKSAVWGHVMGLVIATLLAVLVLVGIGAAESRSQYGSDAGSVWMLGVILAQVVIPYAIALLGGWLWAKTIKPRTIYAWAPA